MHNPVPQAVAFKDKVNALYVKLDATTPDAKATKVELGEIGIKTKL